MGLGLGGCVKSNVTVGNGAEVEMVAMVEEHGRTLGIGPERSIFAADDVIVAIAMAVGGNG